MDSLFTVWRDWAYQLKERGQAGMMAALIAVLGTALSFGCLFIPLKPIEALIGTFGGIAWFISGYIAWSVLISDSLRARTDLRANVDVVRRRLIAGFMALIWFPGIYFLSHLAFLESLPIPWSSAVISFVILLLRIGNATEAEREYLDAQLENAWAMAAQKKQVKTKRGRIKGLLPFGRTAANPDPIIATPAPVQVPEQEPEDLPEEYYLPEAELIYEQAPEVEFETEPEVITPPAATHEPVVAAAPVVEEAATPNAPVKAPPAPPAPRLTAPQPPRLPIPPRTDPAGN